MSVHVLFLNYVFLCARACVVVNSVVVCIHVCHTNAYTCSVSLPKIWFSL